MKIDIILAGVGGQGILSIANIIGHASKKGQKLKQAEVHGIAKRGMCNPICVWQIMRLHLT